MDSPISAAKSNFNPRTPHGVRQARENRAFVIWRISIHAPLTGCDRVDIFHVSLHITFQSTHPSRGATGYLLSLLCSGVDFNPRTPHGVRRWIMQSIWGWALYFNPRTPHGVRLCGSMPPSFISRFQSTHPSRGATGLTQIGIYVRI